MTGKACSLLMLESEADYARFGLKPGDEEALVKATPASAAVARADDLAAGALGMITWNTDNTDVDLHVIEPSGEECFYSHRETRSGGTLTRDVTRGYGPEMYLLPRARPGKYLVRAHYFASDRNRATAATKVYATPVEHWGEPDEKATERAVVLEAGKQTHDVAELVVGPGR